VSGQRFAGPPQKDQDGVTNQREVLTKSLKAPQGARTETPIGKKLSAVLERPNHGKKGGGSPGQGEEKRDLERGKLGLMKQAEARKFGKGRAEKSYPEKVD